MKIILCSNPYRNLSKMKSQGANRQKKKKRQCQFAETNNDQTSRILFKVKGEGTRWEDRYKL